ncbi:NB-ARC domain-containing protein [Lentzea sp. CA-135723]|uniref:NB-ARC domain-containing protein n=1 Tax=Lentzea sp. CA-135723 TaxID=3239950 RepID=UPI003D94EF61
MTAADPPPLPSFGQSLLRYRTAAKLSQAELARVSGMSVRALRDLERGRASAPQERSAELLAAGLGLAGDERESFLLLAKEGRRRSTSRTVLYALPAVPRLVGREDELARLEQEAETGGVVVVVGPPGVGKTSLAAESSTRLAARFPDGCLALDLRGVDQQPVAATVALERMLTALGVSGGRLPSSLAERASLFRTLLRDRRMLVVLDNAADENQVRPLLAKAEHGLTIVTCRGALAGLDHARRLTLDVLPRARAVELLESIAGAGVVRADEAAAAEIVSLCGNLPLAVRIIGNRLATRRSSLTYLVRQLRDERVRLNSLSAGDLHLRSAFEVSLRKLTPLAQQVFRRLALIPGADFDDTLASVAADVPAMEIGPPLHELVQASLLTVTSGPRRLQFHDLIRLFADECLADDPDRERLRANLHAHLLARATQAAEALDPEVCDAAPGQPFVSSAEATEWLDRETGNWQAAQREAAALGRHEQVRDFAWAMHWYALGREARYDWDEVFGLGLEAARALGDRAAEADLLNRLGSAQLWGRSDVPGALARLQEALALADEIGHHRGATIVSSSVALGLAVAGAPQDGLPHARCAVEMAERYDFHGVRFWMSLALGTVLEILGDFDEALAIHQELLAQAEAAAGRTNEATARQVRMLALVHVGTCLSGVGRWQEAASLLHEARMLTIAKQAGYGGEAELALHEGIARRHAGEVEHARTCLLFARDLLRGPQWRHERDRAEAELALLPD